MFLLCHKVRCINSSHFRYNAEYKILTFSWSNTITWYWLPFAFSLPNIHLYGLSQEKQVLYYSAGKKNGKQLLKILDSLHQMTKNKLLALSSCKVITENEWQLCGLCKAELSANQWMNCHVAKTKKQKQNHPESWHLKGSLYGDSRG